MKKIVLIAFYFVSINLFAQVGIGTNTPHVSSILDLTSTTKGLLLPRLTFEQKSTIISPTAGLVIWCTNCGTNGEMQVYNGNIWTNMLGQTAEIPLLIGQLSNSSSVAYSLRKVNSSYSGFSIRVRRSSDNTEQNIGFDGSGNLDQTALSTFVGGGNGFVTTWYDQSGFDLHATQATTTSQPMIVNAGNIITRNNRPAVNFTNQILTSGLITASTSSSYVGVVGINGSSSGFFFGSGGSNGFGLGVGTTNQGTAGTNLIGVKEGVAYLTTGSSLLAGSSNLMTLNILPSGQSTTIYRNGVLLSIAGETASVNAPTLLSSLGGKGGIQALSNGFIQEFFSFSTPLSNTDRQTIESNQLLYYSLVPIITYTTPNTYTTNIAITTLTPTNQGGPVTSYSISPTLPTGLSFNTSTGAISGTPTVISGATTYTVTATNASGSTTTSINITVN